MRRMKWQFQNDYKSQLVRRRLVSAPANRRAKESGTPKDTAATAWLRGLLDRRPVRLASVAQANKTARIVWAVLTRGGCQPGSRGMTR